MEEACGKGFIKSLGISNFCQHHIDELLKTAVIKPQVNQIKVCPGQLQKELADYSRQKGMIVEGYSPLGTGGIFKSEQMKALSKKYKKTIAQLCVRWSLQNNCIPLPKSVKAERIAENADVFDFELSPEDCNIISGLSGLDIIQARNPDEIQF